jgi:hypothetical protein
MRVHRLGKRPLRPAERVWLPSTQATQGLVRRFSALLGYGPYADGSTSEQMQGVFKVPAGAASPVSARLTVTALSMFFGVGVGDDCSRSDVLSGAESGPAIGPTTNTFYAPAPR